MRMPVAGAATAIMLLGVVSLASPQVKPERDRARIQNRAGWENMTAEAWAAAAKSFQQAIEIDPEFEIAYYGLGRANMALKKYVEAIAAYAKCRDLYRAQAGRQFSNAQEAQRYRNNRITEIDEQIRSVQSMPSSAQSTDLMRQLQNQKRDLQDSIQRGTTGISIENTVPAYVSLALGSAYFRAEKFADAEREYKAAIAADSKAGEAHNNLAVVYLQTGRYEEADKAVKAAEKAGFRVNPMLKEDIAAKKKTGSN